jgi:hypothetical protein
MQADVGLRLSNNFYLPVQLKFGLFKKMDLEIESAYCFPDETTTRFGDLYQPGLAIKLLPYQSGLGFCFEYAPPVGRTAIIYGTAGKGLTLGIFYHSRPERRWTLNTMLTVTENYKNKNGSKKGREGFFILKYGLALNEKIKFYLPLIIETMAVCTFGHIRDETSGGASLGIRPELNYRYSKNVIFRPRVHILILNNSWYENFALEALITFNFP